MSNLTKIRQKFSRNSPNLAGKSQKFSPYSVFRRNHFPWRPRLRSGQKLNRGILTNRYEHSMRRHAPYYGEESISLFSSEILRRNPRLLSYFVVPVKGKRLYWRQDCRTDSRVCPSASARTRKRTKMSFLGVTLRHLLREIWASPCSSVHKAI